MSLKKNAEDPMESVKDKQVNLRRTGGASKAERSMREVHHGIFCTCGQKDEENLEKDIHYRKASSSRRRGRSPTI